MLLLAAMNRFWLVPNLQAATPGSQTELSLFRLRYHVIGEQLLGVLIIALGARPLYASGATRQVAYRLDGKQGMVSGNRRPCFEGHGPQRGQSPPLSQLQQIVCGADNAPFRLHLFEAP